MRNRDAESKKDAETRSATPGADNGRRTALALSRHVGYDMNEGEVLRISPDSSEMPDAKDEKKRATEAQPNPLGYRALVALKTPYLQRDRVQHKLAPGMQVTAEINLGSRTG